MRVGIAVIFQLISALCFGAAWLIYFKMMLESAGQSSYLTEILMNFLKPKTVVEKHRGAYPRSNLRKWALALLVSSLVCFVVSEAVQR